ncbi:DMT family transporter [Ruminococcaceae bacterium OttesenSCG-928-D13]|nr:DMT family transporter [Ruminococcaceae bacterium OttesenSCG-928-D13]
MAKPAMGKTAYTGLVILESILWGVGNPVLKIGMEYLTPFWCLTLRFFLAFILFAIFFGRKALAQVNRSNVVGIVVSAVFNAGAYIFSAFALLYTSATIAGFLMSLAVLFTPFLSLVFIRQPLDWRLVPIIGVVVVGMYFLCGGGEFVFGWGEFMGVLGSLSFACGLVTTSRLVGNIGPTAMSCMQVGVMTVCCLIPALLTEDWHVLLNTPARGWAAILYMALGCTFVAYLMQNLALSHVSPVVVSLAFSSEPVFTAIAAFFMLGERLPLAGLFGAALVTAGIVLASVLQHLNEKKAARQAAEQSLESGEAP